MTDTQFSPLGTVTAPADWRLPPSLELVLKAAQATYDGTGAGGSFLPALQIVSDSGHSVGIYPCDTTIAAGSSCEVSFFPFSPSSAAAGGAGIQFNTDNEGGWLFVNANATIPFATDPVLSPSGVGFKDSSGGGIGLWDGFAGGGVTIIAGNAAGFPFGGGGINLYSTVGIGLTYAGSTFAMGATPVLSALGNIHLIPDNSLLGGLTVIIDNMPTSAVGLAAGALWNNAGVVNIV